MKILAIDTTAKTAAAAITDGEKLLASATLNTPSTHSVTMLPTVEMLLKSAGITASEIDIFAVSAGPGSFTGVRIGVSLVKGLAFGRKQACVGVSSLEALARNMVSTDGLICPVMDARRNQLYNAIFEYRGGKLLRLTPDRTVMADALARELESMDKPVFFIGDGYHIMEKKKLSCQRETPVACRWQNGAGVALAALAAYDEAEDKSVFTDRMLRPEYLRLPQAERELREKEARAKN